MFQKTSEGEPCAADILKPGTDMVCAGYCMYGSAIDLCITFMNGVHRFTLDDSIGESRPQPQIQPKTQPQGLP